MPKQLEDLVLAHSHAPAAASSSAAAAAAAAASSSGSNGAPSDVRTVRRSEIVAGS